MSPIKVIDLLDHGVLTALDQEEAAGLLSAGETQTQQAADPWMSVLIK